MKRYIAALLPLFCIAAWDPGTPDHYAFETKEFYHQNVQIEVIQVASQKELEAKARSLGRHAEQGKRLQAFSVFWNPSNRCTIYIVDPDVVYKPAYMGHELAHCVYGRFHPKHP